MSSGMPKRRPACTSRYTCPPSKKRWRPGIPAVHEGAVGPSPVSRGYARWPSHQTRSAAILHARAAWASEEKSLWEVVSMLTGRGRYAHADGHTHAGACLLSGTVDPIRIAPVAAEHPPGQQRRLHQHLRVGHRHPARISKLRGHSPTQAKNETLARVPTVRQLVGVSQFAKQSKSAASQPDAQV